MLWRVSEDCIVGLVACVACGCCSMIVEGPSWTSTSRDFAPSILSVSLLREAENAHVSFDARVKSKEEKQQPRRSDLGKDGVDQPCGVKRGQRICNDVSESHRPSLFTRLFTHFRLLASLSFFVNEDAPVYMMTLERHCLDTLSTFIQSLPG